MIYHQSVCNLCCFRFPATLGHKVNHSFTPNCHFGTFDHPRFGTVPSVVTSQRLERGAELTAYYNYSLSECPAWYSDLWEAQRGGAEG